MSDRLENKRYERRDCVEEGGKMGQGLDDHPHTSGLVTTVWTRVNRRVTDTHDAIEADKCCNGQKIKNGCDRKRRDQLAI